MARRIRDIDADPLSAGEMQAPRARLAAITPTHPAPAPAETPDPTPDSPALLGGGIFGGGVVLGGGVLHHQPTYAQPLFIVGTEASDYILGGFAADLLYGAGGDDYIQGGDGGDTIVGGTGNDTLNGDNGADWIIGDSGDDRIDGGAGNDRLEGREGMDFIRGGAGADVVNGGAGNDQVDGGLGVDVLIGGEGRDVFILGFANSSPWGAPQAPDTIADFESGRGQPASAPHDVIWLRDVLNGTTFRGTTVKQAFDQGYVYLVQHGSRGQEGFGTTVYIDRNGKAADIAPDLAVADVLGVGKDELTYGYYNPHFMM
jgi:Ca2+-binding RTX toxin-like protein